MLFLFLGDKTFDEVAALLSVIVGSRPKRSLADLKRARGLLKAALQFPLRSERKRTIQSVLTPVGILLTGPHYASYFPSQNSSL
jgi:hypothetical protein